jgi:hypothetical protein
MTNTIFEISTEKFIILEHITTINITSQNEYDFRAFPENKNIPKKTEKEKVFEIIMSDGSKHTLDIEHSKALHPIFWPAKNYL